MPLRILSGSHDAPLEPLRGAAVTVVGYGNQGAAHARNLRDSDVRISVASRPGAGWDRAVADGFAPVAIDAGVRGADLVIVGLPDETHAEVWRTGIAPHVATDTVVGFLHGFSVHYGDRKSVV